MNEATPRHPVTLQKVVYSMPGAEAVTVARDIVFRTTADGPLEMDVYYPPASQGMAPAPGVVFVSGFPGVRARARLGCCVKEMESYIGWARLVAASGMVAVTYENRNPAEDLHAVFEYLRREAASLGVDASRLGAWACSGNGPLGLAAAIEEGVVCAVLLYSYLLDFEEATGVAEASAQWGFVNAAAGRSVYDVPRTVPLFIVRAGRDQFAGVNASIDRFVTSALALNLPITFVNHADAPHAFDVSDDSPATRAVIRSALAFLQSRLAP